VRTPSSTPRASITCTRNGFNPALVWLSKLASMAFRVSSRVLLLVAYRAPCSSLIRCSAKSHADNKASHLVSTKSPLPTVTFCNVEIASWITVKTRFQDFCRDTTISGSAEPNQATNDTSAVRLFSMSPNSCRVSITLCAANSISSTFTLPPFQKRKYLERRYGRNHCPEINKLQCDRFLE